MPQRLQASFKADFKQFSLNQNMTRDFETSFQTVNIAFSHEAIHFSFSRYTPIYHDPKFIAYCCTVVSFVGIIFLVRSIGDEVLMTVGDSDSIRQQC